MSISSSTKLIGGNPPQKPKHPLIEINGYIDCGKTLFALLLAERLDAAYLSFPIFNGAGSPLINGLLNSKQERNPHVQQLLFAANLQENQHLIDNLRLIKPVIVVNYVNAFNVWCNNLGVRLKSSVENLPTPDSIITLTGSEISETRNIKACISQSLKRNINTTFSYTNAQNKNAKMINISGEKLYDTINQRVLVATQFLKSRHNFTEKNYEYTRDFEFIHRQSNHA